VPKILKIKEIALRLKNERGGRRNGTVETESIPRGSNQDWPWKKCGLDL
jgi:hypothetical protein